MEASWGSVDSKCLNYDQWGRVGMHYVLQGGNLVKNRMVKASQVSNVAHGPLVDFDERRCRGY